MITRNNVKTHTDSQLSIAAGRLADEADRLAAVEHLVETNAGTYSSAEAGRARGSGDPRYSDWSVYLTVGGVRREVGDSEGAPGYTRRMYDDHRRDAKRLAEIRAELALARAELARRHPDHSDWPDGY